MNKAKQEQSENRRHRTPKRSGPQHEYKMRKHSHEGIEMQMHDMADHKLELVIVDELRCTSDSIADEEDLHLIALPMK